ncbi:conserved hypothetical protein [Sphingomonas sp. EC-HK361]|uniref:DUF6445 family protein n=1 Tax=Sphingomonas sp. EC-HK361 TaxID=2038397 RepID=UPI0012549EA6|nr:DUF6445 family protein [Sphingomonas sp. EC-HK361]VVS96449.1 conserved hypothetical protein [Sphingomonas sp. EC-HK361]
MNAPRVTVRLVGAEREPVAIIENFARDPDGLRRFAAQQRYEPAGRHYPGIKATLPDSYMPAQATLIGRIAREVFGAGPSLDVLEARFSIVTASPDTLSLSQRLPHVDALEPGRLALIHYLVPDGTDGTAFYRQRSSGYETVDAARSETYFAALNEAIAARGPPPMAYIAGDTPLFDQTACIPGAYNRALLYRSRMLHSGAIPPHAPLPADPQTGRLTITGFFAT